jgi:hypothetical protein
MRDTISHNYPYTGINFKYNFDDIYIHRRCLVNNIYLGYGYFTIYLFLLIRVIYGLIESSGNVDTSYWELLFLKIVSVVLISLTISGLFAWFGWILFNKHELSINTSELRYKLTVIFPIIQYKIPITEIKAFWVSKHKDGFGIFFSTIEKPKYIFHFVRYNCSRSYEKEISELTAIVHSIRMFVKQQKKGNKNIIVQKTTSQIGRWKCCFVDDYQPYQQFTRRGNALPLLSYISSVIAGIFFIGVTSVFFVTAFCSPLPDKSISLPFFWTIRIVVVILILLCMYILVSFIIVILHPFVRFSILVYHDHIVLCRNIFGLNLTKTWYYTDIKRIKKSHTKEYTVWDHFRNPESPNGQINPAPFSIQLFDQQNNLLGEIKDLLLCEVSVFISTIEKSLILPN